MLPHADDGFVRATRAAVTVQADTESLPAAGSGAKLGQPQALLRKLQLGLLVGAILRQQFRCGVKDDHLAFEPAKIGVVLRRVLPARLLYRVLASQA